MLTASDTTPSVSPDDDIARLNRDNFRSCLEAMARPGRPQPLRLLCGSPLLAMASVLLYSKTRYCYQGDQQDFQLIEAMTGAQRAAADDCHYLFADAPSLELLERANPGSLENPETSATCIFTFPGDDGTPVLLRGPGIKEHQTLHLPLARELVDHLIAMRPPFPLGIDLFLLDRDGFLLGLPRTTAIEVLP